MLLYKCAYFSACREKKSVLWEGRETLSKCMCLKLGCEFVGMCLHGGVAESGMCKGSARAFVCQCFCRCGCAAGW